MALILPYRGRHPRLHQSVFLAQDAVVVGDVEVGEGSSLWFKVVVRGDVSWVRIGKETNIQDSAILHVTGPDFPLVIGSGVSIGHGAVVHGCEVGDNCLIGIRAVVLDGAKIGESSIIAAGALVPEGAVIPPNSLVMGVPGKVTRKVGGKGLQRIRDTVEHYRVLVKDYREKSR